MQWPTAILLTTLLPSPALAGNTENQPTAPSMASDPLRAALTAKGPNYQPRSEHLNADGTPQYTNRLILEDSPYLLQHAHNPVDWYSWGEEAFAKAKRENKPIFLSIGYSTCHWCHVMERESFENTAIADYLNTHFVAIKVDRESRPDIDEIYMTAVTLMTGHGGWPLSSFLTPDGRPFYGGTYFPPDDFRQLLQQVQAFWQQQPDAIEQQAEQLSQAVDQVNNHRGAAGTLARDMPKRAMQAIVQRFDNLQGGFSQAPKFPQEPWLFLLIDQLEREDDPSARLALTETLIAMARGGIHDQIGGGFHRYATDNAWLIPHFEKMLYNQANLARAYLRAWQLTGITEFIEAALDTLDFTLQEMRDGSGAFYSAYDADSEGEEGTFYLWKPEELDAALSKADAELIKALYQVTKTGNFEGSNILYLPQSLEDFAEQQQLSASQLKKRLHSIKEQLRQVRNKRPAPLRDDKIITAWNGMMISALAQTAHILRSEKHAKAAVQAATAIWQKNRRAQNRLWRVRLGERASVSAGLEDYAFLAEGLLHLYDLTADRTWLDRSKLLVKSALELFDDGEGSFYLSEAGTHLTALSRPKDAASDGALPSASGVLSQVLTMLWRRTGNAEYRNRVEKLISSFTGNIAKAPAGYTSLLLGAESLQQGESGSQLYAANGGIRVNASLEIISPEQQLLYVHIKMDEGLHINANQLLSDNLVPTRLNISGVSHTVKNIRYPAPLQEKLDWQQEPLLLYKDKIEIVAELQKTDPDENSGAIRAELRLQACNDKLCLPPQTLKLLAAEYF